MVGSAWFGTDRGGSTRYFSDLFAALQRRPDISATAAAFGVADPGGQSWGSFDRGTISRVRSSRSAPPADTAIVDRHYALYGRGAPRGASVVTHFHGPWSLESAAAGKNKPTVAVQRFVEQARYRRSERFVVLSRAFKALLVERYRVHPEAVSVIPPGVDLTRFEPSAIPDGPPRVLCVRRLERRMGLDVLLDAWPAVLADVPDAQLDIIGTGSIAGELSAHVAGLGIEHSVKLCGQASDAELTEAYRAATVTVVPTRSLEGFGLIALESLAAGRAPVVTDVGGLPDSVHDLAHDLVVPPENPAMLAERLVGALQGDRPDVARCRAHAENFSWSACADRHAALYHEVRG
ncbi:glycosyltransferase family 4 protein [Skermania sp. ID1734]|nr:glycosyltransferase family 4 protein [Skermania sp. ID1734]TSE00495.1 glycosyltransferase family 4 protein [Skermania sp. ID1734]